MEGVESATNVSFARGVVGEAESPGYNMPWDLLHLTLLLPLTDLEKGTGPLCAPVFPPETMFTDNSHSSLLLRTW